MTNNLKIHIIGGTGQMGNWFKNFFESQNIKVTISGKIPDQKSVSNADIIFVSVPISITESVIKNTAPIIKQGALLVDVSSVKKQNIETLESINKDSLSIHPLFGPTITSIENQKIIFIKTKKSKFINSLKNIFESAGAQAIEMTAKEHDFQMAHIQSLIHFVNLTLAKILLEDGINISGKISTPVFLSQLATINRVISQNPKLLAEIEINNTDFSLVAKKLIQLQSQLLELIDKRKTSELEEIYKSINKQLESSKQDMAPPVYVTKKNFPKIPGKNIKLAYLGPEGTFSHQAALLVINKNTQLVPCKNITEIFEVIALGEVEFGIVPAENSTGGTIRETLDNLVDFDLKSNAGFEIPIHQNLLSKELSIKNIKKLISHSQGLSQCKEWIKKNLPNAQMETSTSTLSAVKILSKGDAIIGPAIAAKIYHLNNLANNIEDSKQNTTKFYIISKSLTPFYQRNRTLLFLTVFNRVGVLRDILSVFADSGINLSKIESRPSRDKKWDYHFFVEVEVSINDQKLTQALNILRQFCPIIKILGEV